MLPLLLQTCPDDKAGTLIIESVLQIIIRRLIARVMLYDLALIGGLVWPEDMIKVNKSDSLVNG